MQTIQNINRLQAILEATVSAFYNHVGDINPSKEFDYYVKYIDGKMAVHLYFVDYFTESKYENDPHINHLDKQELYFSENTKISKAVNDITTELERIHDAEIPELKYKHDVQKCNSIDEVRIRSVTINKYKRFLTKIIK